MSYSFFNIKGFDSVKSYKEKVVVSGKVLEFYEYEMPVIKGLEKKIVGRANASFTSEEVKEENRSKTLSRAKSKVRRVVNANPHLNKFLTLTFAENLQAFEIARYEFDKFIKRLKTRFGSVQFVEVPEFQKRGAIHFHMVCNLPYVDVNELAKIWGNGFLKINRIDNIDDLGAYITKYMTKDNMDERLIGKKCYSMSKGLKEPKEYTNKKDIVEIRENLDCVKSIYSAEFETEHYGIVKYTKVICDSIPKLPNRLERIKKGIKPYLIPMPDSVLSPFDLSLNGV